MSAGGAAAYLTSEALRRGLSRRKVLDQVFVLVTDETVHAVLEVAEGAVQGGQ